MRGRELKLDYAVVLDYRPMSPAMRGRELKHREHDWKAAVAIVARHARARIETSGCMTGRAGAASPAMRGRELKHFDWVEPLFPPVARHARARIETWMSVSVLIAATRSPAMRGRELKQLHRDLARIRARSPAMRGRELKLVAGFFIMRACGRPPCAGAN